MSYTKLFSSIVTSTIWTEDATTCKVWVTMLAIANKHGEVLASVPGLAQIAGLSLLDAEMAIDKFLSPDKYSRTSDDEGRRIEVIDGGWVLLNHAKYRAMASKDEEKTASAIRQKRFRDKQTRNEIVTESNATVTPCNDAVTPNRDIAEADTEADTNTEAKEEKNKTKRVAFHAPSLSDVEEYGKTLSPQFTRASAFVDFYESKGWLVGKSPMKSWQAAVRTWSGKDNQPTVKPAHRQVGYQENLELP